LIQGFLRFVSNYGRGDKDSSHRSASRVAPATSGLAFGDYNEGMKFRIVLEYDAEAQAFSAVCPELPGCASAGDTEEEAKQNIREAIELYLAPSDVELSRNAKLDEVTVG